MRDLVIVPTFARPEYLHLMLEAIEYARDDRQLDIRIWHDRHERDSPAVAQEIEATQRVVDEFSRAGLSIKFAVRHPHSYVGNCLNHMEAYKAAWMEYVDDPSVRYIYHIEDDVIVAPDFFRWHEAAQQYGNYFVTVGWHCIRNPHVKPSHDPTALIESAQDLSSIGLCWNPANLAAIVKHATKEYYGDLTPYLAKHFPDHPIPCTQWSEQAGLVFRVMLASPNVACWPALARCAHVGISGYHREGGHRFTGTLEERVNQLRAAIQKTETLVGMSRDPFDDVQALADIGPWEEDKLHVVQRFPHVIPRRNALAEKPKVYQPPRPGTVRMRRRGDGQIIIVSTVAGQSLYKMGAADYII